MKICVVAGLIPNESIQIGGYLNSTIYRKPVRVATFAKDSMGDATMTITICKAQPGNPRFCNINLFLSPASNVNNFYSGQAFISGARTANITDFSAEVFGKVSNPRIITYQGEAYNAVDIVVRQYGSCYVYITGIHSNIDDIQDVTGKMD